MLIERSGMLSPGDGRRTVLELSIMKQGPGHVSLDKVVDYLHSSVIGSSTDDEHILGWSSGFKISDDRDLVCYAIIDFELDQED